MTHLVDLSGGPTAPGVSVRMFVFLVPAAGQGYGSLNEGKISPKQYCINPPAFSVVPPRCYYDLADLDLVIGRLFVTFTTHTELVCSVKPIDRCAGEDTADCVILDPQGRQGVIKPVITHQSEDNYLVEYTPKVEGLHSVSVFFVGQQIPNSPCGVMVGPHKSSQALPMHAPASSRQMYWILPRVGLMPPSPT
ncbi:hypothetical protein SprV_0200686400 [Sparganum proliferum]